MQILGTCEIFIIVGIYRDIAFIVLSHSAIHQNAQEQNERGTAVYHELRTTQSQK